MVSDTKSEFLEGSCHHWRYCDWVSRVACQFFSVDDGAERLMQDVLSWNRHALGLHREEPA